MMSSCTTTGDPTQGGLWGWSETKSIQRVDALRAQDAEAQAQYDAVMSTHDKKVTQLNKEKAKTRAAQQAAVKAKADALRKRKALLNQAAGSSNSNTSNLQSDVKLLEIR